jgi:hypothetical protein
VFPAVYVVNRTEFEPLFVTPHCVFISTQADRAFAQQYSDLVLLLPESKAIEIGIQTYLETDQPVVVVSDASLEIYADGTVRKMSKEKEC